MLTNLIILYLIVGITYSIHLYHKDKKWKQIHGDVIYTSLFERIIYVILWPIVFLIDIEC
jgi:hypothetical protein